MRACVFPVPFVPRKALIPGEGVRTNDSNAVKRSNLIRVIVDGMFDIYDCWATGATWRVDYRESRTATPAGQAIPVPPWPQ